MLVKVAPADAISGPEFDHQWFAFSKQSYYLNIGLEIKINTHGHLFKKQFLHDIWKVVK